jgi:hypothetical protein
MSLLYHRFQAIAICMRELIIAEHKFWRNRHEPGTAGISLQLGIFSREGKFGTTNIDPSPARFPELGFSSSGTESRPKVCDGEI